MAFSGKLASLFVEFTASGWEKVQQATAGIQANLEKVEAAVEKVGRVTDATIGRATLVLTGFVTAGIATSNMGAALGMRMEVLSRSIASVFLPAFESAIAVLDETIKFFQGLSGAQQANLRHWVEGALAVLAFVKILPLVTAGIGAVTAAVATLSAVTEAFTASISGGLWQLLQALLAPLAKLAALAVGVGVGVGVATGAFASLTEKLGPVFEAIQKVVGALAEAFKPALDAVVQVVGMIADTVLSVLPTVIDFVGSLGKALATVFQAIVRVAKPVVAIFGAVLHALEPILRVAGHVIEALAGVATVIAEALAPPLQLVAELIEACAPLVEKLANLFESVLVPAIHLVTKALELALKPLGWFVGLVEKMFGLHGTPAWTPKAATKAKDEGPHRELGKNLTGTEATTDMLNRLQAAGLKADFARTTAESTKKTAEAAHGIFDFLKRKLGGGVQYAQ